MPTVARYLLLLALLLLVACAKPAEPVASAPVAVALEPPPQAGSCLTQAVAVCQDFHGAGHSPADVQSTCDAQQLRYATGACPTEDRVGTCLLFANLPTASRLRYYDRFALGEAGAREQCETKLRGRWLPG